MLGSHVDVPGDLTLLASQAHAGHGGHISSCMFPYIPGQNETSGGPRVRVGNAVHGVKHLLPEREGYYLPENSCADVPQEELTSHVLVGEWEAGTGM